MSYNNCICGAAKIYAQCCGKFIEEGQAPATPEELMRSRYTAYTQSNIDYIEATMKSPAADQFDPTVALGWSRRVEWNQLEIVETSIEGDKGYVEFIAQFSQNNKKHILHELSEFRREEGIWYYIDGQTPKKSPAIKTSPVGRNDPCLCGSRKKYKKCCGFLK